MITVIYKKIHGVDSIYIYIYIQKYIKQYYALFMDIYLILNVQNQAAD